MQIKRSRHPSKTMYSTVYPRMDVYTYIRLYTRIYDASIYVYTWAGPPQTILPVISNQIFIGNWFDSGLTRPNQFSFNFKLNCNGKLIRFWPGSPQTVCLEFLIRFQSKIHEILTWRFARDIPHFWDKTMQTARDIPQKARRESNLYPQRRTSPACTAKHGVLCMSTP